tara:strand:- start:584 stop:901 length:318 start_codon:yes stop_codon:yes gene_type:complete
MSHKKDDAPPRTAFEKLGDSIKTMTDELSTNTIKLKTEVSQRKITVTKQYKLTGEAEYVQFDMTKSGKRVTTKTLYVDDMEKANITAEFKRLVDELCQECRKDVK